MFNGFALKYNFLISLNFLIIYLIIRDAKNSGSTLKLSFKIAKIFSHTLTILTLLMDKLTPEQRRKNMQAVQAKGSVIEMTLAEGLWAKGYRYRKNDITVFGKPDFTFKKLKIAIFVDSEFWHGKDWEKRKHDHKSNQAFWHNKIEKKYPR